MTANPHGWLRSILGSATGALMLAAGVAGAQQPAQVEKTAAPWTPAFSGEDMFRTCCTTCHGTKGRGDGPAAAARNTRPADLGRLASENAVGGVVLVGAGAVGQATAAAAQPTDASQKVRPLHPSLVAALDEGQHRSATFRQLMARLEDFDAIVYLVLTPRLPRGIDAGLLHWVGGNRTRLLQIHVSSRLDADRLVSVVGHELQHAVEALDDPRVVDGETMRARFDHIGVSRSRARDSRAPFETEAAVEAGRRIGDELARGLAANAEATCPTADAQVEARPCQ